MNRFIILLISLLLLDSISYAQVVVREYGKLSQAEFDLTEYADDPDADALILFDIGRTTFYENLGSLDIRFERTVRIKILKESGIDQANIALTYYVDGYGKTENIVSVKATCYNYENMRLEKSALDNSDIATEQLNERWKTKRFAIPGVKVGSIFEYSYIHTTPFLSNLPDWEFQSNIPTLYSSYQVKLVPFYEYVLLGQGFSEFSKQESYEDTGLEQSFAGVKFRHMVHLYEMENIPAFYDDQFITSRNDYIKKIDFQLSKIHFASGGSKVYMTTWGDLVEKLGKSESFGKFIKSAENKAAKNIFPQLDMVGKTKIQQIEILTNYVRERYKWNEFYGHYAMSKPNELENNKSGSAADLNLFLTGLLRAAGFESYPIIISTRAHGKIRSDYPFESSFNYVITMVEFDDQLILLDATEDKLPFYLLPLKCLNDHGLVVKDEGNWVDMNIDNFSKITQVNTIQVSSDSLIVLTHENYTGYDAFLERGSYEKNKEKYEESKIYSTERIAEEMKYSNFDDNNAPFIVKVKKKKAFDTFESDIYINPFSHTEFSENPLKLKKRDYPVDFVYKKERIFTSNFFIPDHLELKTIPTNLSIDDDLMTINYTVLTLGNTVKIDTYYKLKKSVYAPSEYEQLKNHFKSLHDVLNQQIVLSIKS